MQEYLASLLGRSWKLFLAGQGTTGLGFVSPFVVACISGLATAAIILKAFGGRAMVDHWKKNVLIVLCGAVAGNLVWYGSLLGRSIIKTVFNDHQQLVAERNDLKDENKRIAKERDDWKVKANAVAAYRPNPVCTVPRQEEALPRLTIPYSVGVLTNYNSDRFKNQGTFIVLTNKTVTPVQILVTCEKEIDSASVAVLGSSVVFSGGYNGRVTNSLKQFAASVGGPAWTPTAPILVTVYAKENPGRCSIEPEQR